MSINIRAIILAAAVACLAWTAPANAQGSYAKTAQIWASQGRIPDISVTNSSAATQLPLIGQIARLCNTGSNDAYVAFGSSSVTVTAANGSKLVAGTCWGYDLIPFPAAMPFPYVAAITASSTTTIYVETGIGSPPLQIGSSGGGGSNASVGATGATAPTSATLTGMTQGGNLVAMTGTAGNLNVQCANCSGSGVSTGDEAAFVAGTSLFAGGGGFFQTTATSNPLTTGQQGMFQLTANRALFSNLRNAAGTEVGTAAVPLAVTGSGSAGTAATGVVTIQGIASMTKILVTPDANSAVNLAQVNGVTTLTGAGAVGTGSARIAVGQDITTIAGSAPGTAGTASSNVVTVQGIASMTPLLANPGTAANWGVGTSTQNSATVANGQLGLAQFNTTPTTITSGNMSPLQLDAAGNLLVNIKAGAGSGGTAIADNAAFTQGITNETPIGCYLLNGSYSPITAGHVGVLSCTNVGSLHTTIDNANANLATNADAIAAVSSATAGAGSPVNSTNYVFNGTTFDRMRSGTTTGSVLVNGAGTAGTAAGGILTVQGVASMTKLLVTPDANSAINLAQVNGVTTLAGDGASGTGAQRVTNSNATPATPIAATASDNHVVLKNGAGTALSVHTSNNSATKNYLRLYDAGTGFNGCNSATGVIFAFEIPPNDGGFSINLGGGAGIGFTNGLSWCITSGFGLTDTTAATALAIYANASFR